MQVLSLILVGAIALGASAAPTSSSHVVHEKRDAAPLTWEKRDRLDPGVLLPVRIGLTQSNLEHGPSLLDAV